MLSGCSGAPQRTNLGTQIIGEFRCRVSINDPIVPLIGQHRSTQRKPAKPRSDEKHLTAAIVRLASTYGRYGYRRITALLRGKGWMVNAKRVERIWRREGLKLPQRQPNAVGSG